MLSWRWLYFVSISLNVQNVPYKTQLIDQTSIKAETSIQEAHPTPPSSRHFPSFAMSFSSSSLTCCSFVGYQSRGNSVIQQHIVFSQEEIYVWRNLLCMGQAWFHFSGYINIPSSRMWCAEISHALLENPLHLSKSVFCVQCLEN
jgi:hypothetical protein